MRKFMYFLSADAAHMQTRLERLANKGLELTDTEGLFTAGFEETGRTDLKYLVVPYGSARNFPDGAGYERFGWTLMGGFNGMAIFKSLPCVEPDAESVLNKMKADGRYHPDKFTVPVLVVLVVAWAVALLAMDRWVSLGPWYLSYFGLGVQVVRAATVVLAAANLFTLRSYPSAWVHGLTSPLLLAGLLFLILMRQLDESAQTAYFVGILLILAIGCAVGCAVLSWRRCLPLVACTAGACLIVLCLGLLFPNVDRADTAGKGLHNEVSDAPVLQLSDLGYEDALNGTGYQTGGTFLVRQIGYWEIGGSVTVSSEVYRCLTGGLAEQVMCRCLSTGTWTETDDGWSSPEGTALLLRRGNAVALVTYSQPLTADQVRIIREEVFG